MSNRLESAATVAALLAGLTGCHDAGLSVGEQQQAIRVECAADSDAGAQDSWMCPESVQVDCSDPNASSLQVSSPADTPCEADMLAVTHAEPLTPGSHPVQVRDRMDQVLCTSRAVVVRTTDLQLVAKPVELWPPNHKLHTVSVDDCVEVVGACPGEELRPKFVWVSSDEPVDAVGDGHHTPDIVLSDTCDQLMLRSERQGTMDGRVYTLGVRVVDGAGEAHETACSVSVAHDQSGSAPVASAEAYRVVLDGSNGAPACSEPEPHAF